MLATKNVLNKILAFLSILLFAVLVCVTVWQVFSRQVINSPSTWSEELSKILFVWLSFIGSAFLFGERGHIAVDFIARRLPPAGQKATAAFVQLVILFFALGAMVWGGYLASSIAWEQNLTALPFTIGWVYLIIPVAGVCIAIFAFIDFIEVLQGKEPPYPDIEEAEEPMYLEEAAGEQLLNGSPEGTAATGNAESSEGGRS
ncbi:TRAP transporter small permease [Corynebacterium sp. A21]|uniref:TRAP transporter small permease n=1 Tax=Corynebacterium sp. A21 TaxID=3457318 RepID=UPI003FD30DA7